MMNVFSSRVMDVLLSGLGARWRLPRRLEKPGVNLRHDIPPHLLEYHDAAASS